MHRIKKELHERRFDYQSKERELQSEAEIHRKGRDVLKKKLEKVLTYQEHMDEPVISKQEEYQKAFTTCQIEQSDKRQRHSSTVQEMV